MTERRTRPDGERPLASPTLPGSSSSARSARDLLRDELTGRFPPSVLDDLLLLVSELVSNAAAASSERFRLTVTCDDDMLRVELIDSSEVFPQLADRGPLAENGRGLWLINALALDWGAVPQPFGKMVFTLRVSSQSSLDPLTTRSPTTRALASRRPSPSSSPWTRTHPVWRAPTRPFSASEQNREIGRRRTLGAPRWALQCLFLRGGAIAAVGPVVEIALSLPIPLLLSSGQPSTTALSARQPSRLRRCRVANWIPSPVSSVTSEPPDPLVQPG